MTWALSAPAALAPSAADFLGRLHPVVLHAPIGLLLALAALELLALRAPAAPRRAQALLAWLTALAAALSAGSGWLLAESGEWGDVVLTRHRWCGVALAAIALLLALAHARLRLDSAGLPRAARALLAYRVLLGLALALLGPTGHLGGTLTHGEDYLFPRVPAPRVAPDAPAPSAAPNSGAAAPVDAQLASGAPAAPSYEQEIAPLLEQYCTNCHGASKHKGGLALHTPSDIEAGSTGGPVIDRAQLARSELLRRVRLPAEHEDRMPPPGKSAPDEQELARLEQWILSGASFGPAGASAPPAPATVPNQVAPEPGGPRAASEDARAAPEPAAAPAPSSGEPAQAASAAPTREQAIAALRERFVHVQALERAAPLLWIDAGAAAGALESGALAELLAPLAADIAELSLARTRAGDAELALAARMPQLRRLDLRASAVTSAGLRALGGHARLSELVLAQTRLDDSALDALLALPALEKLYVWNAGLSAEALARLAAERPALRIDRGELARDTPELEPPVEFSSAHPAAAPAAATSSAAPAPPAASSAAATAAGALATPVNALCPVSGAAVRADRVILFEGRAIAFCCEKCAAEFWTHPDAYRAKLP